MSLTLTALVLALGSAAGDATLNGQVIDADTGQALPCRISIQGADGRFYFPTSAAPEGTAIEYRKQSPASPGSAENHVTLSAHPFRVTLPAGTYRISVQRGKEYLPEHRTLEIGEAGAQETFKLKRWIHMAERGWYSGETHVHRMADQLPNLLLAEDLNVALPLTSWVTEANVSPQASNKAGTAAPGGAQVVAVDPTHVFYPRNTEYEIFSVGQKRHTLGALFILNHKTLFDTGVPPVRPVAAQARREGALLDLDKHNWPWSMMLASVFKVDLYELANNHMWETEFAFHDFGSPPPEYMQIPHEGKGYSEAGWIDYTFQNYYALLDCGLRLRPSAGSASGVHPVPLGFGRVYVHVDGPFSYDAWIRGLSEGRSFVTTGPMLFVSYSRKDDRLTIEAESAVPLSRVEVIINGEVAATGRPDPTQTARGYSSLVLARPGVETSSWIAVRCFEERPDKRIRFAHSAPLYIDVPGKPLRPRRAEAEFLVRRMEEELARDRDILSPESLSEYQEALAYYQARLKEAR